MQEARREESVFDVFICHSGEHDEWADSFYDNLSRVGFSVCNDRDHRQPGVLFPVKLQNAIRSTRGALILMGGRALSKPWVREEMGLFLMRDLEESNFRLLPVWVEDEDPTWSVSASFSARDPIDFRPPANYRVAFRQAVAFFRGEPYEARAAWDGPLDLPPAHRTGDAAVARGAVDQVFKELHQARIVALLSQEGALDARFPEMAAQRARQTLGVGAVLSASLTDRGGDFYPRLGELMSLPRPTPDIGAFERGLAAALIQGRPNYLFLRGLERLSSDLLEEVATMLRAMTDMADHYGELRIVLQGGRKLSDLKYADGDHSLLTNAALALWPEMTPEDLLLLAPEGSAPLAAEEAEILLEEAGGRPDLARELLTARAERRPPLDQAQAREILSEGLASMAAFGGLGRRSAAFQEKLERALKEPTIGPWGGFAGSEFQLWAYWSNLARLEKAQLIWRCEALREAGRRALSALQ